MKNLASLILLVLLLTSLQACTAAPAENDVQDVSAYSDKITDFWKWFAANDEKLAAISNPSDPLMMDMSRRLKAIDERLTYECGFANKDKKEMAISADTRPEVFPLVKAVVEKAPKLKEWTVIAFRQRSPKAILKDLAISGRPAPGHEGEEVTVKVSEMRAAVNPVGDRANITVFVKGYKPDSPQEHMANMMLQQATGEYDLVTKVEQIDFKDLKDANEKNSIPFADLGDSLDKAVVVKDSKTPEQD